MSAPARHNPGCGCPGRTPTWPNPHLAAISVTHTHADSSGTPPLVHQHVPGVPISAALATIPLMAVLLADALRVLARRVAEALELPTSSIPWAARASQGRRTPFLARRGGSGTPAAPIRARSNAAGQRVCLYPAARGGTGARGVGRMRADLRPPPRPAAPLSYHRARATARDSSQAITAEVPVRSVNTRLITTQDYEGSRTARAWNGTRSQHRGR